MSRAYRQAIRRLPRAMQYALAHGWRYEPRKGKGKHPRLVKGRHRVPLAGSPSDHRGDLNTRSLLRRLDRQDEEAAG